MVDGAGGRSQLAQIATGAITVIVLLFLTKPLQYLPTAVLASVVFLIGVELVDIKGMRRIWRLRPDEFVVAAATTITVVVVGVEQGIVLAILASVVDHLRRSYRPTNGIVTLSGDHVRITRVAPDARTLPGLVVYRFNASMYYANANFLLEELTSLISSTEPEQVRSLCIDAAGVADVDYSAAETLRQLHDVATARQVRVTFAEVVPTVRAEMERLGLLELFGEDALYETVALAIAAHQATGG
jgi:MFS superfamily sulfate permease-like transporter